MKLPTEATPIPNAEATSAGRAWRAAAKMSMLSRPVPAIDPWNSSQRRQSACRPVRPRQVNV